ncbi:DUF1661 domain-containing protein [Porphyromonas gulae]|nr:DUF1661 domain-containing protein [Porphyromonas gulae]
MARGVKKLRAKTKKISRHFFRKYAPQSERLRHVFRKRWIADIAPKGR